MWGSVDWGRHQSPGWSAFAAPLRISPEVLALEESWKVCEQQ